jgi:hypothetical protein
MYDWLLGCGISSNDIFGIRDLLSWMYCKPHYLRGDEFLVLVTVLSRREEKESGRMGADAAGTHFPVVSEMCVE